MKTKYHQRINKTGKAILALCLMSLAAGSAMAQAPGQPMPNVNLDEAFMRDIKIMVYILVVIALLVTYIATVMSVKDPASLSIKNIWEGILGRNAPDPATDHEYDGIRELDNPMPAWLRLIFYGSIAFGFMYLIHYHVIKTGALQREEYETEMALAAETYKSVELPEDQLIQITDVSRLSNATAIFMENCATCHRTDLGGESGPNLTDEYWLHGGDVKSIYNTITEGVPGKSMISWKDRIPSQQRLELASFILSKGGSKPANPRSPEGVMAGAEGTENIAPAVQDTAASDTSVTQ